jgi:hypothetical protein
MKPITAVIQPPTTVIDCEASGLSSSSPRRYPGEQVRANPPREPNFREPGSARRLRGAGSTRSPSRACEWPCLRGCAGTGGLYSKLGVGGLAWTTATGQFKTAALILGGMGLANITARTLTNPARVKWIAEATKMPPSALPAHLRRLAAIAGREKDPEEKAETEQLFQAVKEQLEPASDQ